MDEPREHIYAFGDFLVDPLKRLLTRADGEHISLTPKVFDTLLYLVENSGKVIPKDELMREIWSDTVVEENNLSQNISVLRRVLGERRGEHRFIATVPGRGFKFVADVRAFRPTDVREEAVRADELPDSTDTAAISREPIPALEPGGQQNWRRFTMPGTAGLIVLAIVGLAFYFWNSRGNTVQDGSIKTVAVLPFKPLLKENRNEALELGMAETLISKLSNSEEIIVRPLESVRRSVTSNADSLVVGRALDVQTVLEGSIQTSGDRIRISARLLRTIDGKQLWAGQFDEKFTDIFSLQDSISEQVAAALKIRLANREKRPYTENVEAYQLYMKGRFHMLNAVESEASLGISYLQQAIETDPSYALAYAGLSDAYRGRSVGGERPSGEFFPKAKAAALKAIEIDDTLAEAHANLAHILFWYDWDWAAAEKEYKRALELNPNSPDALQFYAHFLSCTGRHPEAIAKIKLARELDPLNPRINALEGLFLLHAGRTDEAVVSLQKTLQLNPNHRLANMFAARAYIDNGMLAEAFATTRKAKETFAGSEPIAYGAFALAKGGKIADARAELGEMQKLSKTRYVSPYNFALVYNALGENEKAYETLERAFAEKDARMVFLKVETKWNNLRTEPRFVALIRRMNFE